MFLMIYFGIIVISYVVTFKEDFSDEHLEKAGPFIFITSILIIIIGVLGSLSR